MATSSISTTTIGWVAIATGVSVILAVLCLALMFAVSPSFGKVNDIFNGLIGLSSAVLAWVLFAEHHAQSPLMSQVALALAA